MISRVDHHPITQSQKRILNHGIQAAFHNIIKLIDNLDQIHPIQETLFNKTLTNLQNHLNLIGIQIGENDPLKILDKVLQFQSLSNTTHESKIRDFLCSKNVTFSSQTPLESILDMA
ncbi:MAG: hypothetical protein VW397_06180, partial [Candidatus Margulisiibacteriota bacterium]